MAKIVVCVNGPVSDEKRDALIKRVSDTLGVLPEDVLVLPQGVSVGILEVPADLTKAREKKDAHDKHEAEQKAKEEAKEAHDAEKKAAAEAHKAELHKAK